MLDPDERVRDTIGLSSTSLSAAAAIRGVMRYLNDGIALPDRARNGPARGEIVWRPPHHGAILNMLTSPAHAGAYVGRRIGRPDIGACRRRGSRAANPEGWRVLPDRWPAYIAWSTYEENQKRLNANRSKHKGVPRGGLPARGILHCSRCSRMVTCYLAQRAGPALRVHARSDQL